MSSRESSYFIYYDILVLPKDNVLQNDFEGKIYFTLNSSLEKEGVLEKEGLFSEKEGVFDRKGYRSGEWC